jgi:hypothetical protein
MFAIALKCMDKMAGDEADRKRWGTLHDQIVNKTKKHLWDAGKNKFIPHIYLDGSPFPKDFDENAIHYHGGTAVAIEAGILNREEIEAVLLQMRENVVQSGAPSIGLTIYPPYPSEVLGRNVSTPYQYQNGGDWTWFGGRMIQQLIANGFVEDAYELAQPMFDRVVKNGDFYEWYKIDGTPAGSAEFKGSAGVLAKSIGMFNEWANKNK